MVPRIIDEPAEIDALLWRQNSAVYKAEPFLWHYRFIPHPVSGACLVAEVVPPVTVIIQSIKQTASGLSAKELEPIGLLLPAKKEEISCSDLTFTLRQRCKYLLTQSSILALYEVGFMPTDKRNYIASAVAAQNWLWDISLIQMP